jgi:nucleotide-binding universal stress UspA family protein
MRHLLVPLDGSAFGEAALPIAVAIAGRHGALLDLVTVRASAAHPDIPATITAEIEATSADRAHAYLEGLVERVRRQSDVDVGATVLEGEVAGAIAAHAMTEHPDLVVMSTHGRTGASRIFLGSVTDRLVRQLHVPFVLVHPAEPPANGELPAGARVLVALDGSALAESVLDAVTRLFSPSSAGLHLVRVVAPSELIPVAAPVTLPEMTPELMEARVASGRQYLEGTASALRRKGWHVEHEVVTEWTPSAGVLHAATARACDLIAIATRGQGGVQRMLLGSVADKVIRGAAMPVLVVNPAAGACSRVLSAEPASASRPVAKRRPAPVSSRGVWAVVEEDFPHWTSIETQLTFLLRYAILAPSTRNSQPWNFSVQGSHIHLLADRRRAQSKADPDLRELYISLGCALENLLVAAEHFGFGHGVSYFPEPGRQDLVATIVFVPAGVPRQARAGATLSAILRRHNDNSAFRPCVVPNEVRLQLMACCVESDLQLYMTDDPQFRRWIDALTQEGDRAEFADPAFRRELGHWIGQGAFGQPPLLARLGKLATSRVDLGATVARQDHEIVESAALLGLICATGDSHLAHVKTGQLFERLWLTATAVGVSIHPMSQTMRRPELRTAVAELLPTSGWTPQHLFRVGFSYRQDERHTPRSPVEEVLL